MPAPPKILCLGDFHLGARPSRLPEGVDARSVSAAAAWRRAVDFAVARGVGLVLLGGDLVDRANRYWEAFGPLGDGLRRLADAGVEVCAVAGNHDFDVLARLAGLVGGERFHLIGDGGRWERFTWRDERGRALLHVDGWSFPRRDVREDPLAAYDLEAPSGPDAGAPRVGLLHGDLDSSASSNAPITRAALERAAAGGVDAWILGHLHQPRTVELAGGRWALYPGSLQPRDWTEEGEHGAWIFELGTDGRLGAPEPVPLATVRWETLEIVLDGVRSSDEAEARIAGELRAAAGELALSGPQAPEHLLLRVELSGRTEVPRSALEEAGREIVERLELEAGDARARVAEVTVRTRPPVDLHDLARGDGPPALLAGVLLELEEGSGSAAGAADLRDLLDAARRRTEEVHAARAYAALGDPPPSPEAVRAQVAGAAWSLLEALLAQRVESA